MQLDLNFIEYDISKSFELLTIQFYIGRQVFLLKMVRLEDWIAGESGMESGMSYRSSSP